MSQTVSGRCCFYISVVIISLIYWLVVTPLLWFWVKDSYKKHSNRFYDNWKLIYWLIAVIVFIVIVLIPAVIAINCCGNKRKKAPYQSYFCDLVVRDVEEDKPKITEEVEIIEMEQVPKKISPQPIVIRDVNEVVKRPLRTKKVTSFEIATQTDEEYGIYRSLRSPITPREQFFFSNRYSARGPSLSGDSTFCNYDLSPKIHSKLIKDEDLMKTNKDLYNFINKKPVDPQSIEEFLRNERKFSEIPVSKKKFFIANISPRETLKSEIFLSVQDDVTHLRQKSLKIDFEDDVFD